jgi:hypothetical protein
MTLLSRRLWSVALGGTAVVACGDRTGLLVGDAAPTVVETFDASDAAEAACTPSEVALDLEAPNLYFVLDHSASMTEQGKWTNIRQVVSQLMTTIGAGARFGAAMFPGRSTPGSCATGVEVLALRQGDVQGVTANAFLAATQAQPNGGTPTTATLQGLLPKLSGFTGQTFVILATDGGPNCDPNLSCGLDQCTGNIDMAPGCSAAGPSCCDSPGGGIGCLDGAAAAQATANLAPRPRRTWPPRASRRS